MLSIRVVGGEARTRSTVSIRLANCYLLHIDCVALQRLCRVCFSTARHPGAQASAVTHLQGGPRRFATRDASAGPQGELPFPADSATTSDAQSPLRSHRHRSHRRYR